jgi:hypothetical protein
MDGDGRAELAIYAPWFARPDDDAWPLDASVPVPDLSGAVFVVLSGSTDTNDASEPWSHGPAFWGESVGAAAGHGMHCAHDHDGDGVADLVVGAPFQRTEPQGADFKDRGRVYIVSGGALPRSGRLDRVASIILDGSEREAWFGMSVSGLDALGSGDLAISAPGSRSGRGDVFVYAGQELARGGVPKPFLQISHLSEEADHFGRWLAAGDLDGDGADALFVGAPDAKDGRNGFDTGELWIYRPDTLAALDQNSTSTNTADQRVVGAQPFQRVGRKPLLTDLDGDGTDELLLPTRRAAPDE